MRLKSEYGNVSSGCGGTNQKVSFIDKLGTIRDHQKECCRWDIVCKGVIKGWEAIFRTTVTSCGTTYSSKGSSIFYQDAKGYFCVEEGSKRSILCCKSLPSSKSGDGQIVNPILSYVSSPLNLGSFVDGWVRVHTSVLSNRKVPVDRGVPVDMWAPHCL